MFYYRRYSAMRCCNSPPKSTISTALHAAFLVRCWIAC